MRGVHPLPAEHDVLTQMRQVFYARMLGQAYNTSTSWNVRPKSTLIQSPDSSLVFFEEIVIERNGCLLWRFDSRGWCKNREAEYCIRSAREHAYQLREFHGACGPERFETCAGYAYTNKCGYPTHSGMGILNAVEGREEVADAKGNVAAWCVYGAMLLRDDFTAQNA